MCRILCDGPWVTPCTKGTQCRTIPCVQQSPKSWVGADECGGPRYGVQTARQCTEKTVSVSGDRQRYARSTVKGTDGIAARRQWPRCLLCLVVPIPYNGAEDWRCRLVRAASHCEHRTARRLCWRLRTTCQPTGGAYAPYATSTARLRHCWSINQSRFFYSVLSNLLFAGARAVLSGQLKATDKSISINAAESPRSTACRPSMSESTRRTAVSVEWPGRKTDCSDGRRSADDRYCISWRARRRWRSMQLIVTNERLTFSNQCWSTGVGVVG